MVPALACQPHILQIRLDRPSYPRVGICLLSCAKSLMSFGPEFCSVWNGHQERVWLFGGREMSEVILDPRAPPPKALTPARVPR